jgi:hypothetical protein
MNKYLAAACGAALVIAAASYGYAQQNPGADPKKGEQSGQSAQPLPDKGGKGQPNKGGGKGKATKGTPPGADSPSGEQSTDSAKPKKK